MTLAYLMNTYPMTSSTFIGREIRALEEGGRRVVRFAVRHWDGPLVDEDDIAEQQKTHYLLESNLAGLIKAFVLEAMTNLPRLASAVWLLMRLIGHARGGVVRHAAYLLEAIYFRRQCAAKGVTHVHCHFSTNATTVAMLSKRLGGPTYSFTAHGPDEFIDSSLHSFAEKVENASFVAAISYYCRNTVLRLSDYKHFPKVKIIRCGLLLDDYQMSNVPDNREFVCVGRFVHWKGQHMLPAAAAELVGDFPDLKVVLIGDGDSRPLIEQEIKRLGLEKNFELAGWRSSPEVRELVRRGRVFILPSFAEGLPVVIMEAFALGRPVISTYIAGIPELVDVSCGWLAPATSHDDLVEAMRQALTEDAPALQRRAEIGRARIERRHNVRTETRKLDALFQSYVVE